MAQTLRKKGGKVLTKRKWWRATYGKGPGSSHWGHVVSVGIFFGICNLKNRGWEKTKSEEGRPANGTWHSKRKDASCLAPPAPYWLPHIPLSDQARAEGRNPREMNLTVRWASSPKWGKTIYLYKKLYVCIQSNMFKTIVLILIILQQKLQTVKLMLMA